MEEEGISNPNGSEKRKHKGKHDKPKPWDEDPNIDRWKIEKFDPSWNEGGMLEKSSFETLFPQYREKYIQEVWPAVKSALKQHGISCELNLIKGYMRVETTMKTRDPYIIVKARDLCWLLARSVPAPQALKVLDDEMYCDIIRIGNLVRNKNRFVKRRQRLVGPSSSTLKALEILSGCYILVQGTTVAAMGTSIKSLKQVRRIVEDCIQNKMHPVYHIKILMMKKELEKDPSLQNENWDRFLPKFKKKQTKKELTEEQKEESRARKKKKEEKDARRKKSYTPFPPPQPPSLVDIQLETGEYFLSDQKKQKRKWQDKMEKQEEKKAENKRKREAAFVPPKEQIHPAGGKTDGHADDVAAIAISLKKKSKAYSMKSSQKDVNATEYIASEEHHTKKKPKHT